MDNLADAVAAADSPYALIAIALIGLYALGWRWGGKMLDNMRENTKVTRESKVIAEDAKAIAEDVAEQIVTNHGSKNLGDAVDRITEWLITHMEEARHSDEQLRTLQSAFLARVIEIDHAREQVVNRFTGIDELLEELNRRLAAVEQGRSSGLGVPKQKKKG